ncbi:MAG: TIGR00341 family protein [Promethearchaeota archaeon]|nr:MAG: TIGR00341 family protein [Candidatus Lokiarchaeota archaeon]
MRKIRLIHITLKNDQIELIQKVLEVINVDLNIKNTTLLRGDLNSVIIVRQDRTEVPELIDRLTEMGVGTKYGIIDIILLDATIPELPKRFEDGKDQVTDRIAQSEIKNNIKESSNPSYNYFVFILLSAIIAGAGLILNSPAVIIASMIISPLIGPVLGFSFGIATSDRKMILNSALAQIIGILISITCGILLGYLAINLIDDPQFTSEMSVRYFPIYLDIIVAICAGIAVGYSITGTVKSTLVGTAIALSLMPPAVTIGLALMYGDLSLSFGSLIVLLANIIIINGCTIIVLKIKKVS